MFNMAVPSALQAPTLELTVQHRFSREIGQPAYTLFGGAFVDIGLRYQIWKGIEATLNYGVERNEIDVGAGYSLPVLGRWLSAGAWLHFFTYDVPAGKATNVFVLGAAQSEVLKERLYLTANVGYDGYYGFVSGNLGILIKIVDLVDMVGEYAPVHDVSFPPYPGAVNTFSAGVKLNTHSHHFKFLISNCTMIGPRNSARGAASNGLRFGFSLQKRFTFY